LIKLPAKVPFNLSIQPVALPKASCAKFSYLDREVKVSGFGRTYDDSKHLSQTLNFINLRVISSSDCATIFGSKIVTKNVICAKGIVKEHHNTGACMGDSGGPMVAENDGVITQIGVVSFVSSRGCSYGDPSGNF
jgi:secreted trypsin-like serine protease